MPSWSNASSTRDQPNCESEVEGENHFGYSANQIGFGWTNGVLLELLDAPPRGFTP